MKTCTVRKCTADGTPILDYSATVAERMRNGVRLTARWERAPLDLGYATFETGDHFVEWFYADRWYNVFEIHSVRDGALKGWYCNIGAPATVEPGMVMYRDLYLDVWVAPDGSTHLLDEDEFESAALDQETRLHARAGLRSLLSVIEQRLPPFDALGHH